LSTLRSWLRKSSAGYRNRAERRPSPSLAAYHWDGSTPKENTVSNISASGAFLLTNQRWDPGDTLSLTLQRKGPPARTPEHRFSLQARAVRRDRHGVAVSFVMPDGADLRLWENPLQTPEEQAEPENILREFRVAEAIAFLRRICPVEAKEMKQLLRERLTNYRLESAVEIALHAEELLVFEPGARKMRAHPHLVLRILEDGSSAENGRALQFWAGLLATCCTIDKEDISNRDFIELMSRMTGAQVNIFSAACEVAATYQSECDALEAHPFHYPVEEMIQIAGQHDLAKIALDLKCLAEFGLLVKSGSQDFLALRGEADVTPTSLGLQLFARCHAHRGSPRDFYGPLAEPAALASD
jgi:PilZ domain